MGRRRRSTSRAKSTSAQPIGELVGDCIRVFRSNAGRGSGEPTLGSGSKVHGPPHNRQALGLGGRCPGVRDALGDLLKLIPAGRVQAPVKVLEAALRGRRFGGPVRQFEYGVHFG